LAADLDPRLGAIFVLSILNAIERWYRPEGRWGREDLAARVFAFVREGIGP
jgi:hypothetical protein